MRAPDPRDLEAVQLDEVPLLFPSLVGCFNGSQRWFFGVDSSNQLWAYALATTPGGWYWIGAVYYLPAEGDGHLEHADVPLDHEGHAFNQFPRELYNQIYVPPVSERD